MVKGLILVQRLKLVALETASHSESRAHLWSHLLRSLHVYPGGASCHPREQSLALSLWQHIYQHWNEFKNISMNPVQEVIDLFQFWKSHVMNLFSVVLESLATGVRQEKERKVAMRGNK